MLRAVFTIRDRLDRAGILLSGLCAVHCLLGLLLVSVLGLGGELLLDPKIHEIGLALAILIGIATLGLGFYKHGRPGPLLLGAVGLCLMGAGLAVGHGVSEAELTVAGVAILAAAHLWNLRRAF